MLQTIYNKLYSTINSLRYFITEKTLYSLKKKNLYTLLKKKNPLISIICPTYNRCELLVERAIKSVLNQTYENFELLIIN